MWQSFSLGAVKYSELFVIQPSFISTLDYREWKLKKFKQFMSDY